MRKKRYFHPSSFSLSEIEEFYEEKARKGLFLEKRRTYLSRFRLAEPKELLYRVEVVDYNKEENRKISEAQVAVYEDCGWTYVCGNGYIHVFSADKEADVPELYYNPEDQIETVKILRKSNIRGMISMLVTWVLIVLVNQLSSYPRNNLLEYTEKLSNDFYIMLIDAPAIFLGVSLFLVITIVEIVFGISSSQYHIVMLRKGIPLRKIRPFARKLKLGLKSMLAVSVAAILFMGFMEILSLQKDQDPSAFNGPYMTLEDFGVEKADASEDLYYIEGSYKHKETIWGEVIKTVEYSNTYDSTSLYQDVYQVKNEKLRNRLVQAFSVRDYFGLFTYDSEKITVDGLDEVYILDRWQMVVVKDDIVIRILYHLDDKASQEEILVKISEILSGRKISLEK